MKATLRFTLQATVMFLAIATGMVLRAGGADDNAVIRHRPLGLHVQLSTSAYEVEQPVMTIDPIPAVDAVAANPAILPVPVPLPGQRDAITAAVALTNRSRSDISFVYPDGASAAAKFEFQVLDKDGNEVWRSEEGVGPEVLTEQILKRGKSWRRVVRIPLVIEGVPLPVGVYTIYAFTDADKMVTASSVFEVVPPPSLPARGKMNGKVVKIIPPVGDGPTVIEPVPDAWVIVQQIVDRPDPRQVPFQWSGHADENGLFELEVPAGKYRVTAGENIVTLAGANNLLPTDYPPVTVEVSVGAGEVVDVLIELKKVRPPTEQGILGKVVQKVVVNGESREVPVSGARVQVTELESVNALVERVPFAWKGTTDAEGNFRVKTPVGKFKVVATKLIVSVDTPNSAGGVEAKVVEVGGAILPIPSPSASVEVAVEAGKFSQVKLVLPAIRNTPIPPMPPMEDPVPVGKVEAN